MKKIKKNIKGMSVLDMGFTLVEILVVIAIIGILATLAIISYTGAQKQARDTQRKSDIKQYQMALESYSAKNNGTYPVSTGATSVTDYCVDLEMDSCPDDPVTDDGYRYTSDGLTYTLNATLESKEVDWVASSDGTTTEQVSVSTTAPTSVATATATAVATARPTATATSTSKSAPTAIPTATTCSGCYSGGVCYSGLETTLCGRSGETCVNCSLQDRPDIEVYYTCNEAGRCHIPSVGEPL